MPEAKKVSPREALANRITDWLSERSYTTFTAPYGVINGMHVLKSGKGKARCITFGIARTLDASLFIWSPTRLILQSSRGDEAFTSEQEFYDFCVKSYGAKP